MNIPILSQFPHSTTLIPSEIYYPLCTSFANFRTFFFFLSSHPPTLPFFHTIVSASGNPFFIVHRNHNSPRLAFSLVKSTDITTNKQSIQLISTTSAQHEKASVPLLKGGICLPPNGNSKPHFTEKHSYTWRVYSTFLLTTLIFRYIWELTLKPDYQEWLFSTGR